MKNLAQAFTSFIVLRKIPGRCSVGIMLAAALSAASCSPPRELPPLPAGGARRIVSMSPSATEILFAIGAGDRVVGVTSYCNYPPEAAGLPRVGGYYDANYEAIFSLRPDLVVTLTEHADARQRLREIGLRSVTVDTFAITNILSAIRTLGELCGANERAQTMAEELETEIERTRAATAGAPRVRALVSIGRNMGSGRISDLYAAGPNTLYDELLTAAGGTNVYGGPMLYAIISNEALQRLQPEVIVDFIPDLDSATPAERERVAQEWQSMAQLDAVRAGRVVVYGGEYVCIPGPRFIRILRDIARAVHPERYERERAKDAEGGGS